MAFATFVADHCAALPGAALSHPFGPDTDVWKVGGKIFACVHDAGVAVKTPDVETAAMLIEVGAAVRAPYFHRSWVRLADGAPEDELAHRIERSYALVRSALPKKVRVALEEAG